MNQTFKHVINIVLITELGWIYPWMCGWMDVGPSRYRRYGSSTDYGRSIIKYNKMQA